MTEEAQGVVRGMAEARLADQASDVPVDGKDQQTPAWEPTYPNTCKTYGHLLYAGQYRCASKVNGANCDWCWVCRTFHDWSDSKYAIRLEQPNAT